jgi:hypothetical protein
MAWQATGMPRPHPSAGAIGSKHWLSTLVWKRAPGHPTEITPGGAAPPAPRAHPPAALPG